VVVGRGPIADDQIGVPVFSHTDNGHASRRARFCLTHATASVANSHRIEAMPLYYASAQMSPDKHVFISYARRDGKQASVRLAQSLEQAGFRVWRDSRDIRPSQDFTSQIERGIASASNVVACITNDTLRGDSFVRREIGYACLTGTPILAARFEPVLPPVSIATHTFLDFFKDWNAAFDDLCLALKTVSASHPATGRSVDPYYEYLSGLYNDIVGYLDQTVFSLIPLRSTSNREAVEKTVSSLPIAFFKRALSVQTRRSEEPEEQFEGLAAPFETFGRRMLVLGSPGAGKTTSLFAFARDAVARRLDDPSQPLPVLAPISEWRTDDADRSLGDWLEKLLPAAASAGLRDVVERGGALLLLDGLDEIAPRSRETEDPKTPGHKDDARAEFLTRLPARGGVVLTCRVADYQTIGDKAPLGGAVELDCLDDRQMKEYLREFPVLWQALERDEALRNLARTPLLLSILTFAFAGMKEDVRALVDLSREGLRDRIFDTYVSRRYAHESSKGELGFSLEDSYRTLGEAATAEVLSDANVIISRIEDLQGARADEFIDHAIRLNLLVRGPLALLRFVHLMLRDHFVARLNRDRLSGGEGFERASLALGRIGDEASVPTLIGFLATGPLSGLGLRNETKQQQAIRALIDYPVDKQYHVAKALLSSVFDTQTVGETQARMILDRYDAWKAGEALGESARAGSVERRKRVIDFIRDFDNHLTTNVLSGLFDDPDVGEYAQNAVGTMSGSAAHMAIDRWEEYQRRRDG
jgi:hypothetical protein